MRKIGLIRDIKKLDALIARASWNDIIVLAPQMLRRHGRDHALLRRIAQAQEAVHGESGSLQLWLEAAAAFPGDSALQDDLADRLDRAGRPGDACIARFRAWQAGGSSGRSLTALGQYLIGTDQTLTADRAYDGFFFLREALSKTSQPSIPATIAVNAYVAMKRESAAANVLREAIALDPADPNSWRTAGAVAFIRGRVSEADSAFQRTISLCNDSRSKIMQALLIEGVPVSRKSITDSRTRISRNLDNLMSDFDIKVDIAQSNENLLFNLFSFAYHGENDRPLLEKIAGFFRHVSPSLVWTSPHVHSQLRAKGPIRIGFAGSLHIHAINMMIKAIIAGLDPDRFAATCFTLHSGGSIYDGKIGNVSVVVLPNNLISARDIISDYNLDIILYTDVFLDNFFYFLAFSRLAGVQCLWPGHPSTSGLSSIDYFISSSPCEPANAQDAYTEKLLLNPELNLVYPSVQNEKEYVNINEFDLSRDMNIYVCAQTLYKLHPDFDFIVDEILKLDQSGVVVFFENSHADRATAITDRFTALRSRHGENRVRVLPRLAFGRYLGLIEQADVMLDTPHFSGGNTTLQALQLGVPVVTRPSAYLRGRSSTGFYSVMGFSTLVADTDEEYVRLAIRLANDKPFNAWCRSEILNRKDKLINRTDVIGGFADLFEKICPRCSS